MDETTQSDSVIESMPVEDATVEAPVEETIVEKSESAEVSVEADPESNVHGNNAF